ncbi:hypothetical protein [Sporosarcina sp. FSL K6-1508]|uniref:hypothetical protein n=1 Tax=Sporosarcina sp. FSL K6-1508 TaxID=2921553 RepID=UPI0030FCAF3B
MKTFEIDEKGDWTLDIIEGDDELIQSIKHLIYERVGEWFLNEDHGFQREVLEEKGYTESEIVQSIYDAIYQEPRVVEIIKVDYNFNRITRLLSLAFRLRTEDGEVGGDLDVNFGRV